MIKTTLLHGIHEKRHEMITLWLGISDEEMCALPGPKENWTVKDWIAHITFWEHPTLDRLKGQSKVKPLDDIDSINAELLQKSRALPLADVLGAFLESGRQVLSEIERCSDADLAGPSPWGDGKTLCEHIMDDTCEHYEEHLPDLRAWSKRILHKE
jgi:Protein of unknown function (DUF1706)